MFNVKHLLKKKYSPSDATLYGICTKPNVNCFWGAGSGLDCIHYSANDDGTYTYYCINTNRAKQWWDRFTWWASTENVLTFEVNPDAQIWTTNNNQFGSKYITKYNFNGKKIATKSLSNSFYPCDNIEELDISSWDLSQCTNFYAMIASSGPNAGGSGGTKLKTVKMPDDCGSAFTTTQKMFGWHHNLETITGMKTMDFSNVTTVEEMFCECFSLKNVDFKIDNWVTNKCTSIYGMFVKCRNLDFSAIGDFTTWDTSNVTRCGACFGNCHFVDLDISGWDLSKCNSYENLFSDEGDVCAHRTINMSNVKLNTVEPATSTTMFHNCFRLDSVTMKGCEEATINFVKDRLLDAIPDRIASGNFKLILDDGNYKYNSSTSSWESF